MKSNPLKLAVERKTWSFAISNLYNPPSSATTCELIGIANAFLMKITPNMPDNIKHLTSEFIVNKSAFHSGDPCVRLPYDACASGWEEYPLPLFDWSWPELESELVAHKDCLPEFYRTENITTYGDKNLSKWESEIWGKPDCYWLENEKMQELRKIQKQYSIKPARTKKDLVTAIIATSPFPIEAKVIVNKERSWPIESLNREKMARQLPLSELYKPHIIRLVQTRVDSYYLAVHGYNSPHNRQKINKLANLESASRDYESAREMNIDKDEQDLRSNFNAEFGLRWQQDRAKKRLFDKLMCNKRQFYSNSLEDFIKQQEEVSFNTNKNWEHELVIDQTCAFCGSHKIQINYHTPNDLPPYHLLCTCPAPRWETDFNDTPSDNFTDRPLLNKAINKFIHKNIYSSGLGIRLPTLKDMLEFSKAAHKDRCGIRVKIKCFLKILKINL